MKKVLIFLCVLSVSLFLLSGCRGKEKDASSPSEQDTSSEESVPDEIELIQFKKPSDDDLIATIVTSMGEFKAVLYPQYAPLAVENFYQHAVDGYYNGRIFFRVIDNFIIQTGDPKDDGTGGESIWQKPFEDEFTDDLWNFRGALSMANRDDSNGSQFFIVQSPEVPQQTFDDIEANPNMKMRFVDEVLEKYREVGGMPWLDHVHTVFGHVYSGMETVDKIAGSEVDEHDRPIDKIFIESISFNRKLKTS